VLRLLIFCDTIQRAKQMTKEKQNFSSASAAQGSTVQIRTLPDGTAEDGCANGVNKSTIYTIQKRIGVGTQQLMQMS
jgi:hypothetical protein